MEMFSKLNSVGKLVHRNFTVFSFLNKQKMQQYRLKKKDSDKTDKTNIIADLKGEKNREAWLKLKEEENSRKGKICNDDVFFVNEYENLKYPLKDAIDFHREYLLDKSMLYFPRSVLKANFVLNMKTKKTNKFIQKLNGVVVPANELSFLSRPKVVVFCMKPEEIDMSLKLGAFLAGEEELAKKLKQGIIYYEEFDQVVCHTDAVPLVAKLKSVLRDKLPTKDNERISSDLKTLVESYVNGYEFKSKKAEGIPEEGEISFPLGEINWPVEKLMENFEVYFKKIIELSSTNVDGDPVSKVTLTCTPSNEAFLVDCEEIMKGFIQSKSKRKT